MINGMHITGSTKMLMYTTRLRKDKIDPGRFHRGDTGTMEKIKRGSLPKTNMYSIRMQLLTEVHMQVWHSPRLPVF